VSSRLTDTEMPTLKNGHIPQVLATEYARYRDQVIEVLCSKVADAQCSRSSSLVLYDPMAGTAPLLSQAERRGYTAYFNDLNSLHLYVNAAKTLRAYLTFKDVGPTKLLSIVRRMASGIDRSGRTGTEEWIERPVLKGLTRAWKRSEEQEEAIAVLTKAILLLSIRDFSSFIRTKNPTWLKLGGLRPKISVEQAFRSAIDRLSAFYQHVYSQDAVIKGGRIILTDYDASTFAPNRQVDVIVTSPPFCNRLDWDRLYAPEHFFLDAVGVWHTRTEFLGTTAVRGYTQFDSELKFVTERSKYLRGFLKEVEVRQTPKERASDYYVKYFTRYFTGLFRVFDMAARRLRKGSEGIYFVMQENNHRGLRIQIDRALVQSLSTQGFQASAVRKWDRHHLGLQNISRHHRVVTPKQVERIWHAVR
jgi:hypothetical protein